MMKKAEKEGEIPKSFAVTCGLVIYGWAQWVYYTTTNI